MWYNWVMSKKRCSICRYEKDLSDFSRSGKTKAGETRYKSRCKGCTALLDAEYYSTRTSKPSAWIGGFKPSQVKVWDYLLGHPCVDCGESDITVLEFDHVRGRKIGAVSALIAANVRWSVVAEEISKCDVRCSNCHTKITARRGNWGVVRYLQSRVEIDSCTPEEDVVL